MAKATEKRGGAARGGSGKFPTYKTCSVDALIPYVRNSRTHTEAQVDKVAASIKEFGFLNPVIVDGENGIIAGHCRVMAAKKLGMDTVPTIEAAHLTDAQRRAYVIADNRLALDAGWDDEMLRLEFIDIDDAGLDKLLTGFDPDEIDGISFGGESDVLDEMPDMDSSDRSPYQQRSFILHDEQAEIVEDAVTLARTDPTSDTGINENSNGNAITLICRQWVESRNG